MSYASVVADLKLLNKVVVIAVDPGDFVDHVAGESDRSAIILVGSAIDGFLEGRLREQMPSLNSDEAERIFNFEGPCGSFSNRARIAHALGIIDRPTRRKIEVIKEMRNTAAHSFVQVRFDLPPFIEAVAYLFPPQHAEATRAWSADYRKLAFIAVATRIGQRIAGATETWEELYTMLGLPQT